MGELHDGVVVELAGKEVVVVEQLVDVLKALEIEEV